MENKELNALVRKQQKMLATLGANFANIKETAEAKEAELIASGAQADAVKKAKTVKQNAQAREIRLSDMSELWKSAADVMQSFADENVQSIGVYEIDKFSRLVGSLKSEIAIPYAGKVATDDNFIAAFALMKAHGVAHVSCKELQRELGHATSRQANGIRLMLCGSKLFEKQRFENMNDWTIKFNESHALADKLAKIYAIPSKQVQADREALREINSEAAKATQA